MDKTIMLIDGNSLLHRAFHAIPLLETSQGEFTNAVYGFTNMLVRLIREEKPSHIVVAFDKGKKTFRHKRYDDYKGTRKPTAPELREQFKTVRELVQALGLTYIELDDYEADDILGAYARLAKEKGQSALIVTGDRDAFQLIDEKTEVLYTKRGISQTERCDLDYIEKRYGLKPQQLIDVKALMGDASDNIPGVVGVGEKTALKLIKAYQDLDGVYQNLDKIAGKKLPENLKKYEDQAYLSYDLGKIETQIKDLPALADYHYEEIDPEGASQIFSRLEFHSLLEKMGLEDKKAKKAQQLDLSKAQVLDDLEALASYVQSLKTDRLALYLDLEIKNAHAVIHGLALYDGKNLASYSVFMPSEEQNKALLMAALADYKGDVVCPQAKTILRYAPQAIGGERLDDLTIMGHLLRPEEKSYPAQELLAYSRTVKLPEDPLISGVVASYLAYSDLKEALDKEGLTDLYQTVEKPLLPILTQMEGHGIRVNIDYLQEMKDELEEKLAKIEERIYEQAGSRFNINSPKQLSVVLFEDLGLKPIKKTKTGYSTNAEVLEKLKDDHPLVSSVLDYRKWTKLKTTYVEGLLQLGKEEDGLIHTTFHQTVTATGRLSSSDPNLQNIPIRSEEAKLIRRAFIPTQADRVLLAADYSQIELRILAHLSQDDKMITAYKEDQDIHQKTASEVFDMPLDMVSDSLRSQAKAVNFGIVYGISDYGLSRDLEIPVAEARDYIDTYFDRYPGVKDFIEGTIAGAKEKGEVRTILNRKRTIKNINSSNYNVRSGAERMAMNTPVQGSAADLIKLAMIKMDQSLKAEKLGAAMVLQVHDEIILELKKEDLDKVAALLKETMEGILDLSVPLLVDMKWGRTWYDMEDL